METVMTLWVSAGDWSPSIGDQYILMEYVPKHTENHVCMFLMVKGL